jgi:O-antigen/teichoic acid export membrane protein
VSRSSIILRNVASNWIGFAINAAVTFMLTPLILHQLGPARYGIWILTSSIIGYYGLLDIGFRAGVTQYLTRYLSVGDYEKASECISSAVAVLAGLGTAILALTLGAAYLSPHIFHLPAGTQNEAFWCILFVGASSAIQFFFQPYTAVFTATQRFDLANAIGVGTRVLSATSIVFALRSGGGLVGVSAATCASTAVDYIVRWRVALRLAPRLQVSLRHARRQQLRDISAWGIWNFLMSVNAFVYQHGANFLIGTLMPIAAVGHYALATGLTRYIISLLNPVPGALYPAAIELHYRDDRAGLERLYHDGSRLMLLAMTVVVLPAAFWGEDFYRLWIGPKYLSGVPFHSVALLFRLLLISVVTNFTSVIACQILLGSGRIRTVGTTLLCGSILNIGISLALMPHFGLVGVALGVVTASVVIDLITMPLLLQRLLGLSIAGYLRHACVRPLAAAALQTLLFAAIRFTVARPDHWVPLIWQGAVAGIASALVVFGVGLAPAERRRFVLQPLRRFLRRGSAVVAGASDDLNTALPAPGAEL